MIRILYLDPESQREVATDFDGERIRIGREGGNELVLPYMEVSRFHAELSVGPGGVTLTDRSTNGTFVNGQRVFGKQILQPSDRVGVGNCLLAIYTAEQLQQIADGHDYLTGGAMGGQPTSGHEIFASAGCHRTESWARVHSAICDELRSKSG